MTWIEFFANIISYTIPKCIGATFFVYIKHGGPFCKFLGETNLASIFLKKQTLEGVYENGNAFEIEKLADISC